MDLLRPTPRDPAVPQSRRRSIIVLSIVFVAIVVVSTAGYVAIEWPRYSFLDALYMSVITISTAGHLEVHPLSDGGHVWTIVVILSGVATGAVFLSLLGATVVEGQIRRILGRRQLERKIKSLSDHVIVCGYGQMSQMIVADLESAGRKTVVIEDSPERTAAAETAGLLYVLGDAQDEAILTAAGIDRARELVSALPTDAENTLVTLTARQMNPKIRIIARAKQAATQRKLVRAGASRVVCPQVMGAAMMANTVLRPAVVDFVEVASKGVDLEMDQLKLAAGSELAGKSLAELQLPKRVGVHVAAIRRSDGQTIYEPEPGVTLQAGDTVILIGKAGAAAALQDWRL